MSTIQFDGRSLRLEAGESVLECLERHQIEVRSSCRAGVCQSCVLRACEGAVPSVAQKGLKLAWRERGYFLACVCRPTEDLVITVGEAARSYASRVLGVEPLAPGIYRVLLEKPPELVFQAGQFVHVVRPSDQLTRPYSLASGPEGDALELHVRQVERGRMSQWLPSAVGAGIEVRGPFGECIYPAGDAEQSLLLAGTGTGLAPLLGVLRDARRAGHRGRVSVYHLASTEAELYGRAELERCEEEMHAMNCLCLAPAALEGRTLQQYIAAHHPSLTGVRVFLSGNPRFVTDMKRRAYLAGAALEQIHADPFFSQAEA